MAWQSDAVGEVVGEGAEAADGVAVAAVVASAAGGGVETIEGVPASPPPSQATSSAARTPAISGAAKARRVNTASRR